MREVLETVAYLAEKHYYIKVYTQNNIYVPASGIGRLYEKRAPSVFSKAILSADLSVTMGSADQEMHNPCDRAVTIDCRDDGVHVIDEALGEAGLPGPVWHQSLFSLCSVFVLQWVWSGYRQARQAAWNRRSPFDIFLMAFFLTTVVSRTRLHSEEKNQMKEPDGRICLPGSLKIIMETLN